MPVRVPELGGGDGADREGGDDQDNVPQDRGIEPGLALVQAEAALLELEAFDCGPSQSRGPDQAGLRPCRFRWVTLSLRTSDGPALSAASLPSHCRSGLSAL